MVKDYEELIFRELRLFSVDVKDDNINDDALLKAMTLNENLKSLGYCFTPDSFVLLCKSDTAGLYKKLVDYIGHVDAEPMYPGFPDEVMAMDEAEFKFHKILHYMSTYGVEMFFGCEVSKGWLPERESIVRDKEDTFKTELKQIETISKDEMYFKPAKIILSRKMRLTNGQKELVKEAVQHLNEEQLSKLEIPFKENVQDIFDLGVEEKSSPILKVACKNTMDAFKCTKELLHNNKWHLRTSQKRIIAKLLDTYDNYSFEDNLIYSNKRRESIIVILDHIDYTTYSRNLEHVASVNRLKDKQIHSWMSKVEKAIQEDKKGKLCALLKQRPGMFLRMCVRLIGLGFTNEVKWLLEDKDIASKLSTQTIIDLLNVDIESKKSSEVWDSKKCQDWHVFKLMLNSALRSKLNSVETELKDKKVFFDSEGYDLVHSMILKSDEGGYNRGGLAFKIPENANKVRFFVYWNDKHRVDVDLHAAICGTNGEIGHVGWNGDFRSMGVVTSGDITHSDAAEYIDIDLNNNKINFVSAVINLYSGKPTFADVDTCFTGLMGVSDLGQKVKLYSPKACFISHELTSKERTINYGIVNVKERYIRYLGTKAKVGDQYSASCVDTPYSLQDYLTTLFEAQDVVLVENKEDADMTVGLSKGFDVSLIDKNFFIDL